MFGKRPGNIDMAARGFDPVYLDNYLKEELSEFYERYTDNSHHLDNKHYNNR